MSNTIKEVDTGHSQRTGWALLASTVRGLDEAKLKDCKDDIDTLLIFAGLFSAVMTAFLVESYRNLQVDKMDAVVELLTKISSQTVEGHTTTAGFTNSTLALASPSSSPSFKASDNAVCVNILWFASLIFSLSSASLGKQWLREYLAGDFTSPRLRLHIRRYRIPGLSQWKVFEIAAILPLCCN